MLYKYQDKNTCTVLVHAHMHICVCVNIWANPCVCVFMCVCVLDCMIIWTTHFNNSEALCCWQNTQGARLSDLDNATVKNVTQLR